MSNNETLSARMAGLWQQEVYGDYIAIYDGECTRVADVYAAPTVAEDKDAQAVARLFIAAHKLVETVSALMDRLEKIDPDYYRSDLIAAADDVLAEIDGVREEPKRTA